MAARSEKIVMFYPNVDSQATESVRQIMHSRWIGQGEKVEAFEIAIKKTFNIPYASAVNCGSAAMRLALAIAGVGPGDEVITTPQCCTATNHPILEQYAKPVFADIQYLTGNLEPKDAQRRITERTKAIIAVDLGGYPCDVDELQSVAKKNNLVFIQDASDSIGARYKNRYVGTVARFTVFSFGAVQQVTAGEGGMLCCLDEKDALQAQRRRWYGIDRKRRIPTIDGYYDFDIVETGYGYHMTNIAAAIGIVHLNNLEKILTRRQQIFRMYMSGLNKIPGLKLFEYKEDRTYAYQLFTVHVQKRDDFCKMMRDKGIEVSIVHARNDQYSIFGGSRDDLPVVDRYSRTNISLPLHNKLTYEDVNYMIKSIRSGW